MESSQIMFSNSVRLRLREFILSFMVKINFLPYHLNSQVSKIKVVLDGYMGYG